MPVIVLGFFLPFSRTFASSTASSATSSVFFVTGFVSVVVASGLETGFVSVLVAVDSLLAEVGLSRSITVPEVST